MSQSTISRGIHERYYSNLVNITLAVVSIVQGLAFNDLANRFTQIYTYTVIYEDFKVITHFVLCFFLLLRIFQTYITASLHYQKWDLGFADMLTIFIIGLIEYFLFSSLTPKDFKVVVFHQRFLFLSSLAVFGYLRALLVVRNNRFSSSNIEPQDYESEVRLQWLNFSGTLLLVLISSYILLMPPLTNASYITLSLIQTLTLIFNISYSLRVTFTKPEVIVKQTESDKNTTEYKPAGFLAAGAGEPIEIREVKRENVEEVVDLFVSNFAYVYEAMFDTSLRLTKKILMSASLAWNGNHDWGYRRFYAAVDTQTGQVLGLLKIETLTPGSRLRYVFSLVILASTLTRYLGLVGLIRVVRNSKAVQSASLPIFQSDESQIHYLAVKKEHREKSVGSRLVEFACEKALESGKNTIALEVREYNREARTFFASRGFRDDKIIGSEFDYLFRKGRRIRMVKELV